MVLELEERMTRLRPIADTLSYAVEALSDARMLAQAGDENIEGQLAQALNDIALVLDDLGMRDTATRIANEAGELERLVPNPGSRAEVDDAAAEELLLYLQNDSRFWGPRSQGDAIERNYARRWKKGTFDEERAADGYMHVLKSAAQQYVKEHGSPSDRWYEMFNAPTRRAAALQLVEEFVAEAKLGNFRG